MMWKPLSSDFSDHCVEKYTRVQYAFLPSKVRQSSLRCSDIAVVIGTGSRTDRSTFFGA